MASDYKKTLVVNADDYGMTNAISRGIIEACVHGIVTSVSVVTNTPVFRETLSWIRDKDVDIGIHLTIHSGRPLSRIPHGLPFVKHDGMFLALSVPHMVRYFRMEKKWKQWLHNEFRRQIENMLSLYNMITHLDSHYHIHVLPGISDIIAEIIQEYDIHYVRRPYEISFRKKIIHPVYFVISMYACRAFLKIQSAGLPFYGLSEAGHITTKELTSILSSVRTHVGELMVHPGCNNLENTVYYPKGTNHFENELRAVTHPSILPLLKKNNLECVRRHRLQ